MVHARAEVNDMTATSRSSLRFVQWKGGRLGGYYRGLNNFWDPLYYKKPKIVEVINYLGIKYVGPHISSRLGISGNRVEHFPTHARTRSAQLLQPLNTQLENSKTKNKATLRTWGLWFMLEDSAGFVLSYEPRTTIIPKPKQSCPKPQQAASNHDIQESI